jgi:enoyl-CoA hydratase
VAYLLELNRDEMTSFLKSLNAMIRRMTLFPKPMVAAINGHAVAGGLLMALTADYRIGATGAFSIGLSEVKLGIAAPASSIRMATRKLGHSLVHRLCVTGAAIRPEEALAEGIWDLLAAPEDLIDCAVGKASEYARETGAGIGLNKRFLHTGVFDLPAEAARAEDEAWLDAWFSYEAQERLRALVTRA